MKTKRLIILITACLFAAGSIINMHLAQNDHNTDFSLADISVMAQAEGESPSECTQSCFDMKCTATWKNEQCKVYCSGKYCKFGYSYEKIIV
jgi:hypothetical protein